MDTPIVLLECHGQDAFDFLQRQLTADLNALSSECSLGASLLSPKGKVLALMTLCWHSQTQIDILIEASLVAAMVEYLDRFKFRSDVAFELSDRRNVIALKSSKPGAFDLSALATQRQDRDHDQQIDIHIGDVCYQIRAQETSTEALNRQQWRAIQIESGLIPFSQAESDQFVPGLINLDWLGYLSFTKGCYPGQEIVARTRHLGRIKRRLYTADWVSQAQPLSPGDSWQHHDGKVARLICAEQEHGLFLAPVELAGDIVTAPDGAEVRLATAPYAPV